MTGVLIIDKPAGPSSFGVVAQLRRALGEKKIGHTGTLDPMATGVLPLLLGSATRALPFLEGRPKAYEAAFRFGVETDTQDSGGKVLAQDEAPISRDRLLAALPAFTGQIAQVPPMYSALRQNGKRLYELAREGKEVARAPRPVTIYALSLLAYDEQERQGRLSLRCSGGTYVRTLCHDLGLALGSHGCMTALRRTEAAGFTLAQALPLQEAVQMPRAALLERVLAVEGLFAALPALRVTQAQARRFCNGGALDLQRLSSLPVADCRVQDPDGKFLGLGRPKDGALTVLRLFA